MTKTKDLRDQSVSELEVLERDSRKKLLEMRNKKAREKRNENPAAFRNLKRDIARILTILREKEIAEVKTV